MKLRVTEPGEKPGIEQIKQKLKILDLTATYLIKTLEIDARVIRARYNALVKEGFKPEEALEIIKARGAEV